ncbi:protein FAR1-RELATED SEQUENCE 5-like [Carya illinoinensis]|uniref:protein FAR1-RELATED SEQUENCE 5-like n=1 Tax=Carya illinoinensis TaxID=32201 RepID=UPI001C71C2CE|nr:protein FAR1-RELATED SEQUENCE 5-like [Carya illinoinensis]
MLFDINEDLKGTTIVLDDEVQVEAPRSGMKFESENELVAYYKKYVKQEGFGVKTHRTKRDDDGRPMYVTIGCALGGKYQPKNINMSKPCATTKMDCKTKVNAMLNKNDKWLITTVESAHNHITISPKKTRLLRSHKRLDDYSPRILDLNDRAGIRMNKNYFSLIVDVGGFENLDFQEKDCRNFIDNARHLRWVKQVAGDALNVYFQRMRNQNDGFVSSMDVDDDGRLRNVFWVDARSRAAYEYFGDVEMFLLQMSQCFYFPKGLSNLASSSVRGIMASLLEQELRKSNSSLPLLSFTCVISVPYAVYLLNRVEKLRQENGNLYRLCGVKEVHGGSLKDLPFEHNSPEKYFTCAAGRTVVM